jgi:hypothetical protein
MLFPSVLNYFIFELSITFYWIREFIFALFLIKYDFFYFWKISNLNNFNFLLFSLLIRNFNKINAYSTNNVINPYKFILSFKPKNRIYFNLWNYYKFEKLNHTFFSLGLLLKYFDKKKARKKSKLFKLLAIKYFKKFFFFSKIKLLNLYVLNTPVIFFELLNLFNQPFFIFKQIKNEKKKIKITTYAPFFNYYFFLTSNHYTFLKQKNKGRIKRKITKKLVKKNKIID